MMKILDFCKQYWSLTEVCPAFGGAYVASVSADLAAYAAFCRALRTADFALDTEREEYGNRFAAYVGEDETLFVSFFAFGEKLRMVVEPGSKGLSPRAVGAAAPAVTTPLITQVRLAYCKADCGMSYVIRLSDGRFVMIDGGYDEYEEADRLYDTLAAQNVLERPVIAAWFITHPHEDHYRCFMKFCRKYGDRVVLERLHYNWPLAGRCKYPCDTSAFDALVEALGVEVIVPHTGQRFCYGDAIFDVLFACEDLYPDEIRNTNDSSLVLRMELENKRVLWLGDAEFAACEEVCRSFPAGALKCDILQVGHHGYDGGSPELYRRSDPDALLWPCPDFWYHPVRLWNSNRFLRTSPHIRHIFVEGNGTDVLDMSLADPAAAADRRPAPPTPLYDEDFTHTGRVVDLGWSCVTGGDTGYAPPEIHLSQGFCELSQEEGRAVCELLRPGLLQDAPSYTLTLQAGIETSDGGRAGLICNDASPTVWNEDAVLWLPSSEQMLNFELTLDAEKKLGLLKCNSATVFEWEYIPAERRGLYLVLEHACVRLKRIRIDQKED